MSRQVSSVILSAFLLFGVKSFAEEKAIITVLSEPAGAELVIDQHRQGETPITLELTPGVHQFELWKYGYKGLDDFWVFEAQETLAIEFELDPLCPILVGDLDSDKASVEIENFSENNILSGSLKNTDLCQTWLVFWLEEKKPGNNGFLLNR